MYQKWNMAVDTSVLGLLVYHRPNHRGIQLAAHRPNPDVSQEQPEQLRRQRAAASLPLEKIRACNSSCCCMACTATFPPPGHTGQGMPHLWINSFPLQESSPTVHFLGLQHLFKVSDCFFLPAVWLLFLL